MKQRYYYRWFQYLLLSVFAYGLYACQSTALKPGEQSLNHIPASSLLTLNKPLVIPTQLARVYLQAGHIVTTGELNRYNPFCNLEVNTLHSTPVTISPDTFTITRIKSYFENWLGPDTTTTISMSAVNLYITQLYLNSIHQSDVRSLNCGVLNDATFGDFVTLDEFHNAVGDYFSLSMK